LAFTQALVEEHGGTIWVKSVVNEGSRFIFRLPAAVNRPYTPPVHTS
jgi:signal transduction histidine kinase